RRRHTRFSRDWSSDVCSSDLEVISTPKVLTADKQKATVASGSQIPYQSAEGGGVNAVSTTAFIDATLSLDVTPSITPDGKVQMEIGRASCRQRVEEGVYWATL